MAVTYYSNLAKKKARHRGLYEGKPNEVSGRIFLPAGTVLGVGDKLLFAPMGENQAPKRVHLLVIGDTSTAAGEIGRDRILDKAGNPVVVQRKGPGGAAGTQYTSPATSTAAYRAAGQLDGYTETVLATPAKLAGPAMLSLTITTGATVGADTEIFLGAVFDGETSTQSALFVEDQNQDNGYLIGE